MGRLDIDSDMTGGREPGYLVSTLAVVVLLALGYAAYSNTLTVPFHFDDYLYIVDNDTVRSLSNFWPPHGSRYLGMLSFALNYALSGTEPGAYHLVNVLIHLANALLVFSLVLLTFRTPGMAATSLGSGAGGGRALSIAFVAALVFVLHPIETQAVTYVTQRFASLATLFYLLSLTLYVSSRLASERLRSLVFYLAAIAFGFAAQLTKEISFTLPIVIVLYELTFLGPGGPGAVGEGLKERLLRLIPFFALMVVVPFFILGPDIGIYGFGSELDESLRAQQVKDLLTISSYDYFVTQTRVVVTYIRLLLLPIAQNPDYDYRVFHSIFNPVVLASLAFLVVVFAANASLYAWSLVKRNGYGLIFSFGLFLFFITLSVESSVIPINDVIFEHRLYLPSIGFFITLTAALFWALDYLWRERSMPLFKATLLISIAIALSLGIATYKRNALWGDKLAFYEQIARRSPAKRRPHFVLGRTYVEAGRYEEAASEFETAIRLAPELVQSYNMLGFSYYKLGRMGKSIEAYSKALELSPGSAMIRYRLGVAYRRAGLNDNAIEQFRLAIRLDPAIVVAHYDLGLVYRDTGRVAEAIEELERFVFLARDEHREWKRRASIMIEQLRSRP